jgi:murein DD-endopeptidase MepM/ murein hydrolase activator NlpD
LITKVQKELIGEKDQLEQMKIEKEKILSEQVDEKEKLKKLKKEQNSVITSLKSQETKLVKDIENKKKEVLKLENLISTLVKKEISATSSTARTSSAEKVNIANLNESFEKNKAKLPWPVTTGFITSHFGSNPHPVLKRIKVPNDGVNIQTKESEKVSAVFKGTVKKVAVVPGDFKYVVIIQHGNYFTVYAKLKEVNVKMGQKISVNDVIGVVNTDNDGVTELQFQVWNNFKKLDPELWLAKR